MNVTQQKMFFSIGKVCGIHFLFLLINVIGKKDFPTAKLQSHSHETNARKKFCKCFFHGRQNFAQTLLLSKPFIKPKARFRPYPATVTLTMSLGWPISLSCITPMAWYSRTSAVPGAATGVRSS